MKQEFIPYEQSFQLKELGFDEKCLAYWFNETPKNPEGQCLVYYKKPYDNVKIINSVIREYCYAPLYQQAFRWFREKHKLDSYIEDVFTFGTLCYIFVINGNEDNVLKHHAKNTYEEAQLDCLNELIKMVKEQNMFDEYGNLKDELK